MGQQALFTNTTGSNNTAIGHVALGGNTTGSNNIAVGYLALNENTTASQNTAVGYTAMYTNTTGVENVAVGYEALYSNTTAHTNHAFGYRALKSNTTGYDNTAVGHQAGDTNTTGLGNICIGKGSDVQVVNSSYAYVIGTNCISAGTGGIITIGSDGGSNRIYNDSDINASWTRASDERYKKEITDNTDCGLDFINDLRPVTFKWKAKSEIDSSLPDYDASKTTADHTEKMYGLIAQEVKQALDNHNITDFGGHNIIEDSGIQCISQEMFIHPLIKAVQELSAKNDALEARIATLEGA
jgi:hypothetical protein